MNPWYELLYFAAGVVMCGTALALLALRRSVRELEAPPALAGPVDNSASRACDICNGTGRLPYDCNCCGKPLASIDALCATCLANKPPCYEQPAELHRFSHMQLHAYALYQAQERLGVPVDGL